MADDRYVALEKLVKTVSAGDVTNNYTEFDVPYAVTGVIAQVRSSAGVVNITGLTITQPAGKIRVAVTSLASGSVVSVIAFNASV